MIVEIAVYSNLFIAACLFVLVLKNVRFNPYTNSYEEDTYSPLVLLFIGIAAIIKQTWG